MITGLEDGGAERVLSNLCSNDSRSKHVVLPLLSGGKHEAKLIASGIEVMPVGFTRGKFGVRPFTRLVQRLRTLNPDIVQTWMPHGDLVGGLAGVIAGAKVILWGVHHSEMMKGDSNTVGNGFLKLLAFLSFFLPSRIIYTSASSRKIYELYGYSARKSLVVPSGFDLASFRPSANRANWLEGGFAQPKEVVTFGVLARSHPQKNLIGVLKAFVAAQARQPNIMLVMAGKGIDSSSSGLHRVVREEGAGDYVQLRGPEVDVPSFLNSVDYLILGSTHGESFPNVLGEAMACGVPCIASQVGASGEIVGDTGWMVRPGDTEALVKAILDASREPLESRRTRSKASRERISANFSMSTMVESYRRVYSEALKVNG